MVKEKTHNKNMTENKSTCVFFHTAISCLRNMFPKRIIRRGMKDRDRGLSVWRCSQADRRQQQERQPEGGR